MKRLAILCALALSVSLLSGCAPAVVVTSPNDEEFRKEFQEDWEDSMEELEEDWRDALDEVQDAWDRRDRDSAEKDHYWKILDLSDPESAPVEAGTVTDKERIKALDDLFSDGGNWERRHGEDPGDPAYSYIYCQQETLKAGQDPEDREYEELIRFTVSAEEDVVTMVILEDLPSLLNVDLGDILTFTMAVPAETAEALRNPGQFLE